MAENEEKTEPNVFLIFPPILIGVVAALGFLIALSLTTAAQLWAYPYPRGLLLLTFQSLFSLAMLMIAALTALYSGLFYEGLIAKFILLLIAFAAIARGMYELPDVWHRTVPLLDCGVSREKLSICDVSIDKITDCEHGTITRKLVLIVQRADPDDDRDFEQCAGKEKGRQLPPAASR